jgi:hypothetical protein
MNEGEELDPAVNCLDSTEVEQPKLNGPLAYAGAFTHLFKDFDLEKERRLWDSQL